MYSKSIVESSEQHHKEDSQLKLPVSSSISPSSPLLSLSPFMSRPYLHYTAIFNKEMKAKVNKNDSLCHVLCKHGVVAL